MSRAIEQLVERIRALEAELDSLRKTVDREGLRDRRRKPLTRDDAWALLTEFTKGDSLRKHARAVEASMRAYAARFDEDRRARGASPACCTTSTTRCTRARRTIP